MEENSKDTSHRNLPIGKFWFPDKSFDNKNSKEGRTSSQETYGIPNLMRMVDNWRNERETIKNIKEKQKMKSLIKKKKNLERKKIVDREKLDMRKGMEMALQNTMKNKDDCDLLLAELEYYENEGHQHFDWSKHKQEQFWANLTDPLVPPESNEYPFDMDIGGKKDILTLKKNSQHFSGAEKMEKVYEHGPKNFVNKKLIEEVFLRLKRQEEEEEEESTCSLKAPPSDDLFFKESFHSLQNLYEHEMKTLNTKGKYLNCIRYTYQTFPPFPASVKDLDFLSNNPLIIFREWCHFHKLKPIASGKVSVEALVKDYTSTTASDSQRLSSLCTLIHLHSEASPITNEESEILLTSHDLQILPIHPRDVPTLDQALQTTLKNSFGKVKLGTALALALIGKSDENRGLVTSTLMSAVKGITTTEKRIAALAMAYAGIFEYTALHVILEEWKAAQQPHTLQKYLTALRWLSSYETSIIKSVAEYLATRNLHFRLYVCLTLPFLEGNLPQTVKEMLIHLMRNSTILVLRLAAARVLECKHGGVCIQEHITTSLSFANLMRALEVIQLSLMLKRIDPKIAGILFPCLNSDIKNVKIIGLSVTGLLGINNPKFLGAVCNMVNDKDLEIREAALNTLRLINAQGPEIETLILLAIANESNETVFKAILKFIEGTEVKTKAVQKALKKSSKKPHDKENQQLIKNLLESFDLQVDNASISKSPQPPTATEQDARKSAGSQSTIKHLNAGNSFSFEKANFIQEVLLAHDNTKPDSLLKPSGHIFAKTEEEKQLLTEVHNVQKKNLHRLRIPHPLLSSQHRA